MKKLQPQQVLEIYKSSETSEALAQRYGISESMVRLIKTKRVHQGLLDGISESAGYSSRKFLTEDMVQEIYEASGNPTELEARFNIGIQAIRNIKFKITHRSVTESLGDPGEIIIHNLTWDQVCEIRASSDSYRSLAAKYGTSVGTISNIKNFKTRILK